jgi:CheY-like chemotaxis protein
MAAQSRSEADVQSTNESNTQQQSSKPTVLAVDDDPAVLRTALRMLKMVGMDVLSANDGPEAIAVHAEHGDRIGVVLIDFSMPMMNGKETAEALRGADPRLPIIMTSGYSGDDAVLDIPGEGPTGFLQKPYSPEDLTEVLDRVFSERDA